MAVRGAENATSALDLEQDVLEPLLEPPHGAHGGVGERVPDAEGRGS